MTNRTTHTPGPWLRLSGGYIATTTGPDWPSHTVCTVKGNAGTAQERDTADANAALIAAAPDMLAALQRLVSFAQEDDPEVQAAVDAALAAIARAEGR